MHLDQFHKAILRILQRNNRTPQAEIAGAVNLSPSAVNRRIAAMEQAGVIAENIAVIDPAYTSGSITLIVEVFLENERLDLLSASKKRFTDCPNVQQVYYVTGEVDIVLVIAVSSMAEYEQLTHSLFFEGGNVKGFRTMVCMERCKVTLATPIA